MRTIWLASYPKSGNTWMRLLIANLSATDDAPVDINDLPERGGIASGREAFDGLLLVESGVLTHEECDRLRPLVYAERANGALTGDDDEEDAELGHSVRFVKTHDAYTYTPDGAPLLAGPQGAAGAILIVRDPRDVASSLASHTHSTLDAAIAMMNNPEAAFCARPGRQHNQLRQRLMDWSGHAASWLDQRDIPVLAVRYEDMHTDAVGTFRRAMAFAGREATEEQIERAVRFAEFASVQRQEREKGFREAPRPRPDGNFFRRGAAGGWREDLNADQLASLEAAHAPMMYRLGYSVQSGAPKNLAASGSETVNWESREFTAAAGRPPRSEDPTLGAPHG